MLSDVRLPGRDGLALFDELRAHYPALPVILLTAHGTIPDAVAATARGVFGYLTKPFDSQALLAKIRQALTLSAASGDRDDGNARRGDRPPQPVHGRTAGGGGAWWRLRMPAS